MKESENHVIHLVLLPCFQSYPLEQKQFVVVLGDGGQSSATVFAQNSIVKVLSLGRSEFIFIVNSAFISSMSPNLHLPVSHLIFVD